MSKYILENVKDFNLKNIFDCGQCFRWKEEEDGSFTGVAFGRPVNMSFADGTLSIDNCTEDEFKNIWHDYLDLGRDYGEIKEKLCCCDDRMPEAIAAGPGIRILNQDLWEIIISFIISQNNNIPRIKGCIEKLSELFGECAGEYRGREWFNLPSPEVLAGLTVEDLGPVKLGYRAKYLIGTAKAVMEKGLPENEEELLALPGVGPKVANCIELFGMGRMDSFPIDVWVMRVMNEVYGIEESDKKAMTNYAREHFGELGGIAQQYLFYYIREKNLNKQE